MLVHIHTHVHARSIYEMERRLKIAQRFLVPSFELIHWYAAASLIAPGGSIHVHVVVLVYIFTCISTVVN